MKLSAGKRVLMFFHWLLSLLICAAFAVYLIRPDLLVGLYETVTAKLGNTQVMIIGIALLAIYTILAVAQAVIIFQRGRRADRGFITVDSSDTGKVRIAVSAIEQMVRQSVYGIDGISEMRIGIENLDDAIVINIAASILNGSHVPTITMNMQRQIRQFVEMNCGVAVRAVSISINGVTSAEDMPRRRKRRRGEADSAIPAAPAAPFVPAEPAAQPVREPAAEPVVPAYADEPAFEPEPIELRLDPEPAYGEPAEAGEAAYADIPAQDAGEDAEAPAPGLDED